MGIFDFLFGKKADRHLGAVIYQERINGVSFYPAAVKRCKVGDEVRVQLEPENPYDKWAISVYSKKGEALGHLSRGVCRWKKIRGPVGEGKVQAFVTGAGSVKTVEGHKVQYLQVTLYAAAKS